MNVNPFTILPDPELIEACLNGKDQAWEALLTRFQRLIYSIPFRYGLPEHDANDIFQNVSLLLLENLHTLRDRQRLGASLVIAVRCQCLSPHPLAKQNHSTSLKQVRGKKTGGHLTASLHFRSKKEYNAVNEQKKERVTHDETSLPLREINSRGTPRRI